MSPSDLFRNTFDTLPDVCASAPGRVEVIGNHLDYNGGLVVGACLENRISVAAGKRSDGQLHITTRRDEVGSAGFSESAQTTMEGYRYEDLPDWSRYPIGVIDELNLFAGNELQNGLNLAISSDLEPGSGLSSSAALEVATATALNTLFDLDLDTASIAHLSHRAENRYVGVPCGLLDQMTVSFGEPGRLTVYNAATNRTRTISMAASTRIMLIQSHVSRALRDSPYEQRRKECLRAQMGLARVIPRIRHLAHIHPIDVEVYGGVLPPQESRRAFHVSHEQERVRKFIFACETGDMQTAGQMMFDSHAGSRALFENSIQELDFIVDGLRDVQGVLGARLTGAGWGGSVVALVDDSFDVEMVEPLRQAYETTFEAGIRIRMSGIAGGARVDAC